MRVVAVLIALVWVGMASSARTASARHKPRRRTVVYKIKRGDTLGKVARHFRVTVKQIKRWNRLKSDRIVAGRRLRVAPPVTRRSLKLSHPVQLPPGPGYVLKNPDESWGTQDSISVIRQALASFHGKHPKSVPIVVGDVSLKSGGYFPPHVSHQDGRDVDIGLPVAGNRPLRHFMKLTGRTIDEAKAWDLVESFLDTGRVELILLDIRLQRALYRAAKRRGYTKRRLSALFQWPRSSRTRVGRIRHARGHQDHMHVRITKPPQHAAGSGD